MNEEKIIPEWMETEEVYEAPAGKVKYIQKSLLAAAGSLSKIRESLSSRRDVSGWLLSAVLFILLISLSRNILFVYVMLAAVLLRTCFLKGNIRRIIFPAAGAAVISMVIVLPAALMGKAALLNLPCRVFASVMILGILVSTSGISSITMSLRRFHIPAVFIFTLDTAIRYIAVLGDMSIQMFEALKVRTIGKGREGIGGIGGSLFLKSSEMSEEMYQAMVLRGFDGEYMMADLEKSSNLLPVLSSLAVILIYVLLEFVL